MIIDYLCYEISKPKLYKINLDCNQLFSPLIPPSSVFTTIKQRICMTPQRKHFQKLLCVIFITNIMCSIHTYIDINVYLLRLRHSAVSAHAQRFMFALHWVWSWVTLAENLLSIFLHFCCIFYISYNAQYDCACLRLLCYVSTLFTVAWHILLRTF